jgi:hypothetical protein
MKHNRSQNNAPSFIPPLAPVRFYYTKNPAVAHLFDAENLPLKNANQPKTKKA